MTLVNGNNIKVHVTGLTPVVSTVNQLSPCRHSLLRTKSRSPAKATGVLLKLTPAITELSLLRNYGHFLGTNTLNTFIVLTLDKADTMNFARKINLLQSDVCHLSKHTSKDFWNGYFRIYLFSGCTTDSAFSLQLMPFSFQTLSERPSPHPPFSMTA